MYGSSYVEESCQQGRSEHEKSALRGREGGGEGEREGGRGCECVFGGTASLRGSTHASHPLTDFETS